MLPLSHEGESTSSNERPAEDRPEFVDDRKAWFGRRRKRIEAREVSTPMLPSAKAVEREMRTAAGVDWAPVEVIDAPRMPLGSAEPATVIDPTQFSERHRKRGQNFVYRVTQMLLVGSLVAACVAIVAALLEDPVLGRWLAGSACVAGVACVWLVRRSRLAYRLRGYAVAACALAGMALIASLLIHATPEEQHPAPNRATEMQGD
jgi:hypothetical protein